MSTAIPGSVQFWRDEAERLAAELETALQLLECAGRLAHAANVAILYDRRREVHAIIVERVPEMIVALRDYDAAAVRAAGVDKHGK